MASWRQYSEVHDGDTEEKDFENASDQELLAPKPKERRKFGLRSVLTFAGGVGFGIMLVVALHASPFFAKKPPAPSRNGYYVTKIINGKAVRGTQCGDSWQEAKALGCIYDILASRWYAPECFDKESFDAMMLEPGTNFTWYSDKEHTIEVSSDLAWKGEFELLFPWKHFHKIHCLYLWRKMHHALLNNLPLDDDLMEEHHTIHCTQNLILNPKVREVASIAQAGRPFCRRSPLGVMPFEV